MRSHCESVFQDRLRSVMCDRIADRTSTYNQRMKVVWQDRMAQAAGKYGEHAPMATVCCNACRTCVQTNLVGIALGAVTAVGVAVKRLAHRRRAEPTA